MPSRDAQLRAEARHWAQTPEDQAYYDTLNDDQLRHIIVNLAASKVEREMPVDAPANLKARKESSTQPFSSEQLAPESSMSARRMLAGPERAAKALGAGASAAALPAVMGLSGPASPAILGLFSAATAGEGTRQLLAPEEGESRLGGAGNLALAGLPYVGRLKAALNAAQQGRAEQQFAGRMMTEGAPRPYGPSRGADVPYRGPSGATLGVDVTGLEDARTAARIARPQQELDAFNTTRAQQQNLLQEPEAYRDSLRGLREAMVGSVERPAPAAPRSQSIPTVEGREGRASAALRELYASRPQSRSTMRPRGYKARPSSGGTRPNAPSRYDRKK